MISKFGLILIISALLSINAATARNVPNKSNESSEIKSEENLDVKEYKRYPTLERIIARLNARQRQENKRGFDIKTFFSPIYRKDGSVLLIPKDTNKNHYFIG